MIQIVKKPELSTFKENLTRVSAIVLALVASGLIMLFMGYNPFEVYYKIIDASLFSQIRFTETANRTIMLTTLSLGVSIAFRMKFWNIGAEGQLYMGAFGAAIIAFGFPTLHPVILLPLMAITAIAFGGLWALIPVFIKAKFEASETLVTLMLNYVAIGWITYLQYGPWKDPNALGMGKIARFSENAVLPKVFGIHVGWIIMLALVVSLTIILKYTKLGYQVDVIGESETTARYAGMNTVKITAIALLISGGIAGLAGFMQASAIERSITNQMSGGLGFTAIITAWLSKLKPPTILVVSFAFAMLMQSGTNLQTDLQMPSSVTGIMQGIILFFVLASEFFTSYTFKIKNNATKKEAK